MGCDIGRIVPRWLLSTLNFMILVSIIQHQIVCHSFVLSSGFDCTFKWILGTLKQLSTLKTTKQLFLFSNELISDVDIPAAAGGRVAGDGASVHEGPRALHHLQREARGQSRDPGGHQPQPRARPPESAGLGQPQPRPGVTHPGLHRLRGGSQGEQTLPHSGKKISVI